MSRHLVLTVHGIRTFGKWQERLERLILEHQQQQPTEGSITCHHYKYGYFSILGFLIPITRWIIVWRFRKDLRAILANQHWDRIDIVAHSFGTHLVAWGLYGLPHHERPSIHTLILAGSVLKSSFPWRDFVGLSVSRVINECGIKDSVLLWNQLFVLLTGIAGREGFTGMMSESFRNRFHSIGHSGYFRTSDGKKDDDAFMQTHWLPLIFGEGAIPPIEDPRPSTFLRGIATAIFNNLEPIKVVAYLTPVIAAVAAYAFLYIDAKEQSARRSEQQIFRATAEALSMAYRRPEQAMLTAARALEIEVPERSRQQLHAVIESAMKTAYRASLYRQMSRDEALRAGEGKQGFFGTSWKPGPLPSVTSNDGKFQAIVIGGEPGKSARREVYLLDNESRRIVRLECSRLARTESRDLYAIAFSARSDRFFMLRYFDLSVFSMDGECVKHVTFSFGTKDPLNQIAGFLRDRYVIGADVKGGVWVIDLETDDKVEVRSEGFGDRTTAVTFDRTGSRALLMSYSGRALLIEVDDQEEVHQQDIAPVGAYSGAFHPVHEDEVVTVGEGGLLTLWRLTEHGVTRLGDYPTPSPVLEYAEISEDGERIFAVGSDFQMHILDYRTRKLMRSIRNVATVKGITVQVPSHRLVPTPFPENEAVADLDRLVKEARRTIQAGEDSYLWLPSDGIFDTSGRVIRISNGIGTWVPSPSAKTRVMLTIADDVWLGTDQGTFRVRAGQLARVTPTLTNLTQIRQAGGVTMFATSDGAYFLERDQLIPLLSGSVGVVQIAEAQGSVWLLTGKRELFDSVTYGPAYRVLDGFAAMYTGRKSQIRDLAEAGGAVWFLGAQEGLYKVARDGRITSIEGIEGTVQKIEAANTQLYARTLAPNSEGRVYRVDGNRAVDTGLKHIDQAVGAP